jgi:hypothetical protein
VLGRQIGAPPTPVVSEQKEDKWLNAMEMLETRLQKRAVRRRAAIGSENAESGWKWGFYGR